MTKTKPRKTSSFAARLRQAREARGLSIDKAAKTIGLTTRRWQDLESGRGRCKAGEGLNISTLLNVDPFWLALGRRQAAKLKTGKPGHA